MQGGCPCGHTRYEIAQAPLLVHCCHCASCQRELGSAFGINAIIEKEQVKLLPPAKPAVPESKGAARAPASFNEAFARLTLANTTCGKASAAQEESTEPSSSSSPSCEPAEKPRVTLVTFPSESTIGITIAQCPECHTGLWTHYADAGPHTIYLRAGTLDVAHEVDPDVHIFTRSKRAFVTLSDGKPQFEYYYGDRADYIRPDCKERYENLKERTASYKAELMAALGR
jgi:hypothetical protein